MKPTHHATATLQSLTARIALLMTARGAHAARTVVLLPYIHLISVAAKAWAQHIPTGFAPRFETTMTWAGAAGFAPGVDDIAFDMGRDLLTARAWLERAGLRDRADLLASRLVEAAWQLAGVAAAVPPAQRPAWAVQARAAVSEGLDEPMLALEAALARIALEWAAASAYAGDSLLEGQATAQIDLLVVLEGLRTEPVTGALQRLLGDRAACLPLDVPAPAGEIRLHQANDPADEAERAAACVLAHVDGGRVPVALAAIDRVLTRRVRALLGARGVAIRDETGWKLSTTRAAANAMLALRACPWDAGTDAVIDWLKNVPAAPSFSVLALERRVRRAGVREWRSLDAPDLAVGDAARDLVEQVGVWRSGMQRVRPLPQWLAALRALLQATGCWAALERDAAGARVIEALGLDDAAQAELQQLPQAARAFTLAEFSRWADESLEAASFVPEPAPQEQAVILPFNQVLGRPFAALVLAGCDEIRLPAAPEPPGFWSAAQREALGLPSRDALEAEVRAGWRHALQTPVCDVLWRRGDESGEPLLPSLLVQALQLQAGVQVADDPRIAREFDAKPTSRPLAVGQALAVHQLSATAYEDLRRCPYRFFALRQLGLQEADEIDDELDKRDFGNWLHRVLSDFHESLQGEAEAPGPMRAARLDAAAQKVTREQRLDPGDFLPFAAAWPQVRDGYLAWLADHEASERARFERAERAHEMQLGPVKLVGRIDRIDRLPDGRVMVMDYKTEARNVSLERVKQPGEDTQLAFYAALVNDDTLRAAYINVGERGETRTVEQLDVVEARDLLVHGMLDDLERIGRGDALRALGEGKVCDFCSARGLCRRDFWS